MRKRLLVAAFCIFILPLFFSPTQDEKTTNSTPFASVAIAGHTPLGGFCDCGNPGCICDPGEGLTISTDRDESLDHNDVSGFDFSSGALLVALTVLIVFRIRSRA